MFRSYLTHPDTTFMLAMIFPRASLGSLCAGMHWASLHYTSFTLIAVVCVLTHFYLLYFF